MPAASKPSATTAVAESAESERQAAPQRSQVLPAAPQRPSAMGGAGQATAADSDLPELKAFGKRWGLW